MSFRRATSKHAAERRTKALGGIDPWYARASCPCDPEDRLQHRRNRHESVSSVLLHTLVASLLGILIFAIYAQVRDHEFVNLDDPIYVVDNPNLQSGLGLETHACSHDASASLNRDARCSERLRSVEGRHV